MSFLPTQITTKDLKAVSCPDGRWAVKGRGVKPRIVTYDELQSLLEKQRAKRVKRTRK